MEMSRLPEGTSLTRRPPIRSSPPVMSSSPAIIRRVVDLPQPEGPSRISRWPPAISRFRSSMTALLF